MSTIELLYDWLPAEGARGPELEATWARLSLRIGDSLITRVLDERSKTTRDHVYLPLYPLAEWLATHWWILLGEVATPWKVGDTAFSLRHSLADAREGYALPALTILSQGESVQLAWHQEALPFHGLEFLTRGQIDVPTAILRATLTDFIRTVVARLQELGIEGTLLEEEWNAIESTDPEEREYCESTAALGLDPYSLDDQQRREIVTIGNRLPASIRSEFFAIARAGCLVEESKLLLDSLKIGRANTADLQALRELRPEVQSLSILRSPAPAWEKGYGVARELRQRLNLDHRPVPSLPALSEALGSTPAELAQAIHEQPSPTAFYDAVVGLNSKGSPGFVVTSSREESRRFNLCRGLFEFLTTESADAALLTSARSDRQAMNRAFAAEFLAPASGLQARTSGASISTDEVDVLASEFGVSPLLIAHQIENHQIATVSQ